MKNSFFTLRRSFFREREREEERKREKKRRVDKNRDTKLFTEDTRRGNDVLFQHRCRFQLEESVSEREREKLSLRERKEKEREDIIEICRMYFLPEGMEKIESAKSNFHREGKILEGKEKVERLDVENGWKVKSG